MTAIGVTRLALVPLVWICCKLRELVVVAVEGVGWGILPLLEPSGGRRQMGGQRPNPGAVIVGPSRQAAEL